MVFHRDQERWTDESRYIRAVASRRAGAVRDPRSAARRLPGRGDRLRRGRRVERSGVPRVDSPLRAAAVGGRRRHGGDLVEDHHAVTPARGVSADFPNAPQRSRMTYPVTKLFSAHEKNRIGRWLLGTAAVGFGCLAYVYLTLPDVRPLRTVNPSTTRFMELRAEEARAKGKPVAPRPAVGRATRGSRRTSSARCSSPKTMRSGSTRASISSSFRNRSSSTGRADDGRAAAARSPSSWRRICICRRRRTRCASCASW